MSREKHILVLPSWYPPDGGSFFKEHSEALQEAGWTVRLLVNRWLGVRRIIEHGLSVLRSTRLVKEGPLELLRSSYLKVPGNEELNIKRWSAQTARHYSAYEKIYGKPDLILAHSATWAGYAASLIKKEHGIPYILVEHRSFFVYSTPEARKMVRPYYLPYFQAAYDNCSAGVLVSESMKKGFEELLPESLDKLEVIPNMIREDLFILKDATPGQAARDEIRPFTFIWSGRFEKVKGVDVLLEAIAILKMERSDNILIKLAGKGSLRESLEARARELGIEDRISFLGRLDRKEIAQAYREADCFVTPTRYEAFGVVLIEAMASGIPVIATRSGGPEHIVTPETGLLIEKDDPRALADAMTHMIKHAAEYEPAALRSQTIASYGRQAVMNRFSILLDRVLSE